MRTVVLALGSRSQVFWRCCGPVGIWEGILPGWIVQQRVAVCEEPRCRRADLWWCCCIGVTVEALGGFFTCLCLHQQVTVPHTLLETCCCSKQRHVAPTAAHSTSRLAARLPFTPQETRTSTSFLHHASPGSYVDSTQHARVYTVHTIHTRLPVREPRMHAMMLWEGNRTESLVPLYGLYHCLKFTGNFAALPCERFGMR